ncbi:MAG: cobyric acid synthase CobQ, partial [Chloroflexi bacterium]
LHGLFANDEFRRGWLQQLGWQPTTAVSRSVDPFDRLADHVALALGETVLDRLFQLTE